MVLVRKVFCCNSLHYGNLALGLFAATIYLSSIIWLLLIYDEFLVVATSRFLAIFTVVLASIQLINCILLVIGIMLKLNFFMIPWLFGQQVVIAASLIGPIILMGMGTITHICLTMVIMVVVNLYQLYHLMCAYSIYMRNNGRADHQSEYQTLD